MRTAERIGTREAIFEVVTELVRDDVLIELVGITSTVRKVAKDVDARGQIGAWCAFVLSARHLVERGTDVAEVRAKPVCTWPIVRTPEQVEVRKRGVRLGTQNQLLCSI